MSDEAPTDLENTGLGLNLNHTSMVNDEDLAGRHTRKHTNHAALWTTVSAISACLAAIFSGWAAWETKSSAVETARATRAAVFLQLLGEYAAPEMLKSMKSLRVWQRAHPNDTEVAFRNLILASTRTSIASPATDELDNDRRRVSHFFTKLWSLSRDDVIEENLLGNTWTSGTYTFIHDVLMPIERGHTDAMVSSGNLSIADKREAETLDGELERFFHRTLRYREPVIPKSH